ncbi:MAG: 3-methyl-2-oxobutanoate hydroxymethyltransferase [Octadecabacter sp.]|jgi:3-methyl-2-oxobutanoate hydroxymethyltransferase
MNDNKTVMPAWRKTGDALRRVHSMTFEYGLRNYTVHDIRQLKGKRQLTEIALFHAEEAYAVAEAEIDSMTMRFSPDNPHLARAARAAAPHTFMNCSLPLTPVTSRKEARRLALEAMELGADSVICQWSPRFIEAAAECGVPVRGHIGLVPRRSTWTGGLRPVGKTVEQALDLARQLRDLENAGAWAVECEVIPTRVLQALSQRTSLVTVSLGSGPSDVQFLFAQDILGDGRPPFPRHSRQYCDLQTLRDQMHEMRISAFQTFAADVEDGRFPEAAEEVAVSDTVLAEIAEALEEQK